MPNLGERILQLEAHPQFATLTYDEQVKLRMRLATQELANNQQFAALQPLEKKKLTDRIVYRPPVIEGGEYTPGTQAGLQKWLELEDRVRKGENPDQTEINALQFASGVAEGAPIATELGKLMASGIMGLANLITGSKYDTDKEWKAFQKHYEYLNYLQSTDKRSANAASFWKGAGVLGGTVTEIGAFYGAMVGTYEKPVGLVKLAMKGLEGARYSMPNLAYLGLKAGIHSAGGGLVGIIRETAGDIIRNGFDDPDFSKIGVNALKYGFEYALGDMAVFALGGFLSRAKKALGWTFLGPEFTRKKALDKILKGKARTGEDLLVKSGNLLDNFLETFSKNYTDALLGKTLDPNFIAKYGDEYLQTVMNDVTAFGNVFKNVEKPKMKDLIPAIGISNKPIPFVTKKVAEGWKVYDGASKKLVKTFKNDDDILKFFIDERLKLPELKAKETSLLGTGTQKIELVQHVKGLLPEKSKQFSNLLAGVIAPVGGKFKPEQVRMFAREFLRTSGIDDAIISSVKTTLDGDTIKLAVDKKVIAEIPVNAITPQAERNAIKTLGKSLADVVPETAIGKAPSKFLTETYEAAIKKSQVLYTPTWITDTIVNDLKGSVKQISPGTFEVSVPDLGTKTFNNFQDMGDYILKNKLIDQNSFAEHLALYENAKLVKAGEGFQVIKNKKVIAAGIDVSDILKQHPELTPKIPAEYGPEFTFIMDDAPAIMYNNKVAVGNAHTLIEELSKFSNRADDINKVPMFGGKLKYDKLSKEFDVYFPELNVHRTFKKQTDAMKFLKQNADNFDVMEQAANWKGYKFDVYKGQWRIYGDGVIKIARTKREAQEILRSLPSTSYAPELTGIQKEFYKNFDQIPGLGIEQKYFNAQSQMPAKLSPGWIIGNLYRPTEGSLETAIKKGGPDFFLKAYRDLEIARVFTSTTGAEACNLAEEAFKINGKTMSKKTQQKVQMLLSHDLNRKDILDIVENLGLTPEHLAAAKTVRRMYDDMFQVYKINPDKFQTEYLPQMREYIHNNFKDVSGLLDTDTDKLLKGAFKGEVPGEIQAFFRHSRTSDVIDLILDETPLNQLRRYIMTGQREMYIGPILEDVKKGLKAAKGRVDPTLIMRFEAYLQDSLGVPTSITEGMVREFGKRLFQIFGKKKSSHIVDTIIQFGYLSSMAFRPAMPLRNLTQVATTLAPRIGDTWVWEGMKKVMNDTDGTLFRSLVKKGVIPAEFPFYASEEILGHGGKVAQLTKAGMKWFKNSDSWIRAVAFESCVARFDDALKRYKIDKDLTKFMTKTSGLHQLSGNLDQVGSIYNTAYQHMKAGKYDLARDLFGAELTRESMFEYRKGIQGLLFRGSIGKAFGQFGTYTTNFLENIRKGWTRSRTIPQKIAFVSRYFGNTLSLAAASTYIGVKSTGFFPGPLTFSGGPLYHMMNEMLLAMDLTSYRGRQARAKLLGVKEKDGKVQFDFESFLKSDLGSYLTPGGLYFRSLREATKYLNEGDIHKAMLAFTSASIAPE